jgi:aminopeptidase N
VYGSAGSDAEFPYVYKQFTEAELNAKFGMIRDFAAMTGKVTKPEYAQQGITAIKDAAIKYKMYGVAAPLKVMITDIKAERTKKGDTASASFADEAIKEIDK